MPAVIYIYICCSNIHVYIYSEPSNLYEVLNKESIYHHEHLLSLILLVLFAGDIKN